MFIRAKSVLGIRNSEGVGPIYPGCTAEVDDELGAKLVADGFAVEIARPGTVASSKAAPAANPSENPSKGENTQNGPENAGNGQVTGHLDEAQLQEMSYTDLKALAKDMGIETGKIKSKAGMIAAITAVEVQADAEEAPPVFDAQDVIDE